MPSRLRGEVRLQDRKDAGAIEIPQATLQVVPGGGPPTGGVQRGSVGAHDRFVLPYIRCR
jgi:hypothetical protein